MTDRESLAALLRERSVEWGDFVLASGQRSHYYIDARRTTLSARGLVLVGRLGLAKIRHAGWQPRAIGGLTMGADPVAYAIARASADSPPEIEAFSVRKTPKQHGKGRRIEGNFAPGYPVVIVEDVITTGGSTIQAIQAVREEGGEVLGVLAVVDREEGGVQNVRDSENLGVVVLTTITDLGI